MFVIEKYTNSIFAANINNAGWQHTLRGEVEYLKEKTAKIIKQSFWQHKTALENATKTASTALTYL